MMDASSLRALLDTWTPVYAQRFGLSHWRIETHVVGIPDEGGQTTLGDVEVMPERERASVRLNALALDNEVEALATLRHELLHIVVSPMQLFLDSVLARLPEEQHTDLRQLFAFADEMSVRNLERLHYNMERMERNGTPDPAD